MEDKNCVIESRINYWQEFYKTHPDPSPLRSLVAPHPSLAKIFNFCSVPSIWENTRQYPFDDKIAELKTISEKDRQYLSDKHMEHGSNQEWFDYLNNLLQVVTATVRLKEKLDSDNVKIGGKYSQDEIIKIVESEFRRAISVNETLVFKEKNGIQKTVMATGRFWPVRFRIFIEISNRNLGTTKKIYQEHYECLPTDTQIDHDLGDLDRFSVVSFQKHGKDFHNICWGGFHPGLDESKYRKPIESEQHIVELYYKGKRLTKPFVFPIRKRYRPLLKKIVKRRCELLHEAEDKLLEKALRYDDKRGVLPSGYFKSALKYFLSELYESGSTLNSNVPCDEVCKKQKDYENQLPCKYETSSGYCTDPKRSRRLRDEIEFSGGSLDAFIDEDQTTYRVETIEAEAVDTEKETLKAQIVNRLNQEERELYQAYYQEERTQTELAQTFGISQPTVQRRIKELEKKILKMIDA